MEWKRRGENIEVPTYIIVKTRSREKQWEYEEVELGIGDWSDLVYALYTSFGQFKSDIGFASSHKELHEKLDSIASVLEKKASPYEFKLADGTDDWYCGYCKPAIYRLDHEGKIT